MKPEHIDAAMAASASKATYAGGVTTSVGGLVFDSQLAVAVGLIVTVAGFLVNLFFQWRRDRRETRESDARMGLYE